MATGWLPSLYFSRSSATVPGDIFVSRGLAGWGFGPAAPVVELNDPARFRGPSPRLRAVELRGARGG